MGKSFARKRYQGSGLQVRTVAASCPRQCAPLREMRTASTGVMSQITGLSSKVRERSDLCRR
jgi:hypothetical protein